MAVIKRFFFDGDDMREEEAAKKSGIGNTENMKRKEGAAEQQGNHTAAPDKKTESGDEELCMLVSALLGKNGKQYARVSFVRGEDTAEGIVPDGRLEHVSGFSEEEAAGLKLYLAANKDTILAQAKQIDPLTNWLRTPPGK